MSAIIDFETLDAAIKKAGGRPTVLEALWDGDTQGWFLCLNLYTEQKILFFKQEQYHILGSISLDSDLRLFNGRDWTEAKLAQDIGSKAAEKYGLTFYFPSPSEPDNDCPRWSERHLAIHCADCNKLIKPNGSPHLPQDICYHCHITRESNQKLKNAPPYDEGVHLRVISTEGENLSTYYATHFNSFTIAPFVEDEVASRRRGAPVDVVTLTADDILDLHKKLECALDLAVGDYEKPLPERRTSRFINIEEVEYKGVVYELMDRFNSQHEQIAELLHWWKAAQTALTEHYTYQFYFKNGFTYRDDSFIRFIHYVCKGSATMDNMTDHYAKLLSPEEITDTVHKLIACHCLILKDGTLRLTTLGRNII